MPKQYTRGAGPNRGSVSRGCSNERDWVAADKIHLFKKMMAAIVTHYGTVREAQAKTELSQHVYSELKLRDIISVNQGRKILTTYKRIRSYIK